MHIIITSLCQILKVLETMARMINHPEIEHHLLSPMLAWVGRLLGNVYGVVQTPDGTMHVLCHGLRLLQRQLLARITPALISIKY
jgi:hypothetical protein